MALATAARSEPGGCPPAASIRSWPLSATALSLLVGEREERLHARDLEQPLDPLVPAHERQVEPVAAGLAAPAGEQGQPGRVHELEAAQVDHQAAAAAVERLAELGLEDGHAAHVELPAGTQADEAVAGGDVALEGFRYEFGRHWRS